jgi:hypothetical protein
MDNTTVVVVKLDWCIDFITQDEIDGNVDASKAKVDKEPKKDEEDKEEKARQAPSFRNSLEKLASTEEAPKGLYPQVRHRIAQYNGCRLLRRLLSLKY